MTTKSKVSFKVYSKFSISSVISVTFCGVHDGESFSITCNKYSYKSVVKCECVCVSLYVRMWGGGWTGGGGCMLFC